MTVIYTSRMANNTCQSCGHNTTWDIRIYGCTSCGHDGARDPRKVWDPIRQEWEFDWMSNL